MLNCREGTLEQRVSKQFVDAPAYCLVHRTSDLRAHSGFNHKRASKAGPL
jgi:hypothetical protein